MFSQRPELILAPEQRAEFSQCDRLQAPLGEDQPVLGAKLFITYKKERDEGSGGGGGGGSPTPIPIFSAYSDSDLHSFPDTMPFRLP